MPGNLNTLPSPDTIQSWPAPNYDDPHERRTWLVPFSVALLILVSISVCFRLYLRVRNKAGPIGLDDAMLLPGYLLSIPFTVFVGLGVLKWGLDRHLYDVRPESWPKVALIAWLSIFVFLVGTTCTKASVLLFHRRLSDAIVSKAWKYWCIAAMWFTVAHGFVFVIVLVFNCNPTEAYWKAYDFNYANPYHCADTRLVNVVAGVLSTIGDVYSVILPMGMLQHFQVPLRQKIALNIVFSLGGLVAAAGGVRTYYLYQQSYSWDTTWSGYNVYVWSVVEMQLGNVCACAPALRAYFARFFDEATTAATATEDGDYAPLRGTADACDYPLLSQKPLPPLPYSIHPAAAWPHRDHSATARPTAELPGDPTIRSDRVPTVKLVARIP